jgi:hypothetical protein
MKKIAISEGFEIACMHPNFVAKVVSIRLTHLRVFRV